MGDAGCARCVADGQGCLVPLRGLPLSAVEVHIGACVGCRRVRRKCELPLRRSLGPWEELEIRRAVGSDSAGVGWEADSESSG